MLHFGSWSRVSSAMPNNYNSPKAEPFVSASDGEVRIVRPVGGRLADEACARKIHKSRRALSALLTISSATSDFECHMSDLSALDQSERRIHRMPRAERRTRGRARTPHARRARRVTRASTCHECTPAAARRHSRRRVDAEPAKRRVSAFRCVGGKRNGLISRGAIVTGRVRSAGGAMHGQGQKRRRRDARAGSEAPEARCTGRVRSVSDSYVHPKPDSSIPETTS